MKPDIDELRNKLESIVSNRNDLVDEIMSYEDLSNLMDGHPDGPCSYRKITCEAKHLVGELFWDRTYISGLTTKFLNDIVNLFHLYDENVVFWMDN